MAKRGSRKRRWSLRRLVSARPWHARLWAGTGMSPLKVPARPKRSKRTGRFT